MCVCSARRRRRALRPEPLPWSRAETAMTVSENLRRVCECDICERSTLKGVETQSLQSKHESIYVKDNRQDV